MLIGSSYIYYYLKAKNRREKNTSILPNRTSIAKLHDELANDVYQLMKFVENKDISYAKIKEAILQNLDTIYNLTLKHIYCKQ
jgi:hypothetical protein